MPVYWLKYRDDLWKKVTLFHDPASLPPDPNRKKHYANHILSVLPKEDECYAGFESLAADCADGRAKCNIRRAARQIEAYALCNEWEWFATFTLAASKRDRSDLDAFRTAFTKFICNSRRTYPELACLLVPELHLDGENWHMHGLIRGLPVDALRLFTLSEKLPKYIKLKLKSGDKVYDWTGYRDRFGFCDLEAVKCRDAAARYITKYITKDIMGATAESIALGKHLYYPSRGLNLPVLVEIENPQDIMPQGISDDFVKSSSYSWDYGECCWYQPLQL